MVILFFFVNILIVTQHNVNHIYIYTRTNILFELGLENTEIDVLKIDENVPYQIHNIMWRYTLEPKGTQLF